MDRTLLVGASGFVGRELMRSLGPDRGIATYRSRPVPGGVAYDAAAEPLSSLLARLDQPVSHVCLLYGDINPERIAKHYDETAAINVAGMIASIEACFAAGVTPVYFSTDYVFDGTRGFRTEAEKPCPNTAYGRQKAEIETYLASRSEPWLIIRLSKVVDATLGPGNILGEWVRNIAAGTPIRCAYDQTLSPTFSADVADASVSLLASGARGLFNLANPEAFTRLGLLKLLTAHILAAAPDTPIDVTPVRLHDLPFSEKRPLDTSLDPGKLIRATGWRFTPMASVCARLAEAFAQGHAERPT